MSNITISDWEKINNIILEIYSMSVENILEDVMDNINVLVPHSHSLAYYQLQPDSLNSPGLLKSRNISKHSLISYVEKYSQFDFINWYVDSLEMSVFRESDVLPDNIRAESIFMKEWLAPLNIFHGICMVLTEKKQRFGAMFLYRSKEDTDFSDRELEILKIINHHVSLRFTLYPSDDISPESDKIMGTIFNNTSLTKRELEILNMIKSGVKKIDLCENLYITKNTLNKHLDNIYKKLDVHTYEDLLRYLQQNT